MTVVFSMKKGDPEDLEEWELRREDRVQSGSPDVFTHPWKMDTFEKIEKDLKSGGSSVTKSTFHTAQRLQILALDKPLPPTPDDVSSLSDDDIKTGASSRGFG